MSPEHQSEEQPQHSEYQQLQQTMHAFLNQGIM